MISKHTRMLLSLATALTQSMANVFRQFHALTVVASYRI